MMSNSNILKRKNEELESATEDSNNKRVALDSEQIENEEKSQTVDDQTVQQEPSQAQEITKEQSEESPAQNPVQIPEQDSAQSPAQDSAQSSAHDSAEPAEVETETHEESVGPESSHDKDVPETQQPTQEAQAASESEDAGNFEFQDPQIEQKENQSTEVQFTDSVSNRMASEEPYVVQPVHENGENFQYEQPSAEFPEYNVDTFDDTSKYNQRENDPTYVQFRMYCPVKEASYIVGKKGEKINHIREKANVRINVSENLKNVTERIISVRGAAENVARAFGLIARTILEEPEDEPASVLSKQYHLKVLIPHPMVGFIIGKQGSKFREIEENSAAKLKAAEQPLPYSTDRVLSITGVGDAIHIAIYYISQVMIEHKDCLKKNKIVYYNPANYHHANVNNNLLNMSSLSSNSNMMLMGGVPSNSLHMQGLNDPSNNFSYAQQKSSPYNYSMMFQPSISQQPYGAPPTNVTSLNAPPQSSYTDEHGNTLIGDVITNPPVQVGPNPDKFNEDIFVSNASIGSVIGKGGNNIKHIRENSGCTYVKIEPDRNQSIMIGGKGLTNIRRLTLTGSLSAIQTAIYLINQRIGADKERNHIN